MRLERIAGIGPALARRLGESGIVTLDDLAESTPDAVRAAAHGAIGLTEGRAAQWIADAQRQRQAGEPEPEPLAATAASSSGPTALSAGATRHEAFSLRLEIGADRSVQHAVATHVRTGIDQRSIGWHAGWFESVMQRTADVRFGDGPTELAADVGSPDADVPDRSAGDVAAARVRTPVPSGGGVAPSAVAVLDQPSVDVATAPIAVPPVEGVDPSVEPDQPSVDSATATGYVVGGRSSMAKLSIDAGAGRVDLAPSGVRVHCRPLGTEDVTVLPGTLHALDGRVEVWIDVHPLRRLVYRVAVSMALREGEDPTSSSGEGGRGPGPMGGAASAG